MHPQRALRAGTSAETAVLALMNLARGAGCMVVAAFPLADDTPLLLLVGLGLLSFAVGGAIVLAGPTVRRVHVHAVVVLDIALVAVMVAAAMTDRGMMLASIGYLWTAAYVALFLRAAVARMYAALMTAGLGIALLITAAPGGVALWLVLTMMIWAGVAVLGTLSEHLRAQAHTDGLTGLLNRNGFTVAATRQRAISQRAGEPVSLAVIDLDDFKVVNDRDGHAAGDRLLIELAIAWTASLRPSDVLARHGGDEFVLLLAAADERQAERLLGRLSHAHPSRWTAGVVVCSSDESLDDAIERADGRLYVAKAARREAVARAGSAGRELRVAVSRRALST